MDKMDIARIVVAWSTCVTVVMSGTYVLRKTEDVISKYSKRIIQVDMVLSFIFALSNTLAIILTNADSKQFWKQLHMNSFVAILVFNASLHVFLFRIQV